MFYWGDYLAFAIALFIGGFLFGWTTCAFSELKEKQKKRQLLAKQWERLI